MTVPSDLSADEEWRPVFGFEGFYEVSNLGRVRSLDRVVMCTGPVKGTYPSLKKGRLLRPGSATAGHQTVALGKGNSRLVHHLVLEAFVGPCPPKMECRHRDGDETNNRLSNLVWGTRGDNARDKKWHRGCSRYKLSVPEIRTIKGRISAGHVQSRIAEDFDVSHATISAIKCGRVHSDV